MIVVRDVSHIIYLKKTMESKRHMNSFSEKIMKDVEKQIEMVADFIKKIDNHVY